MWEGSTTVGSDTPGQVVMDCIKNNKLKNKPKTAITSKLSKLWRAITLKQHSLSALQTSSAHRLLLCGPAWLLLMMRWWIPIIRWNEPFPFQGGFGQYVFLFLFLLLLFFFQDLKKIFLNSVCMCGVCLRGPWHAFVNVSAVAHGG